MAQKTNVPGFYKVDESIVINKDNEALRLYKKRKVKENKINRLENDLDDLKNDISEIKSLLKGLVK